MTTHKPSGCPPPPTPGADDDDDVSGNIILISSRHNVITFDCIAMISTIAAAHNRSCASSAALLSADRASDDGRTGVVDRVDDTIYKA
jgi:hypothetical protein